MKDVKKLIKPNNNGKSVEFNNNYLKKLKENDNVTKNMTEQNLDKVN